MDLQAEAQKMLKTYSHKLKAIEEEEQNKLMAAYESIKKEFVESERQARTERQNKWRTLVEGLKDKGSNAKQDQKKTAAAKFEEWFEKEKAVQKEQQDEYFASQEADLMNCFKEFEDALTATVQGVADADSGSSGSAKDDKEKVRNELLREVSGILNNMYKREKEWLINGVQTEEDQRESARLESLHKITETMDELRRRERELSNKYRDRLYEEKERNKKEYLSLVGNILTKMEQSERDNLDMVRSSRSTVGNLLDRLPDFLKKLDTLIDRQRERDAEIDVKYQAKYQAERERFKGQIETKMLSVVKGEISLQPPDEQTVAKASEDFEKLKEDFKTEFTALLTKTINERKELQTGQMEEYRKARNKLVEEYLAEASAAAGRK